VPAAARRLDRDDVSRGDPVAGGVAAYVQEGLGADAAAVTGAWFMGAVFLGAPTVSLIGGFYVADLTGSGTAVAAGVGIAMFAVVFGANALGLRVSSAFQVVLSSVLTAVIVVSVAVALPSRAGQNWTPFAPHGWWAVGTAASILVWMFVGWDAVAQLAGDFRNPAHDLPRAVFWAFVVITVVYACLMAATIAVTAGTGSRVPLADLMAVGFGQTGRDATAVLAVALTMGTMNVYTGGSAKLAAALAAEGGLPRWLAGGAPRSVPRRRSSCSRSAGWRCSWPCWPGSAVPMTWSARPPPASSPCTSWRSARLCGSSTAATGGQQGSRWLSWQWSPCSRRSSCSCRSASPCSRSACAARSAAPGRSRFSAHPTDRIRRCERSSPPGGHRSGSRSSSGCARSRSPAGRE
jgi:hypothetical protein